MKFLCEDLARHGLLLVPPSSQEFDTLLADIERRAGTPTDGSPPFPEQFRPKIVAEDRETSAILINRSAKAIAAVQAVWYFETESGRSFRHSQGMLSTQNLLLPWGRRDERTLKLFRYWHTILPGSKRYLGEKSGMVGDNTDVRPPAEDEKWRGGMAAGRGGGGGTSPEVIRQVTLSLDGVFFLDGEFVGPDREKLYERTVADVEAHRMTAKAALEAHQKGLPASEILAEIEKATGPASDHPEMNVAFRNPNAGPGEFRTAALQQIAYQLAIGRRFPQAAPDSERLVVMVLGWNDTVLPEFRKAD